jgi:serine phosphatase RsbU (regulator of sigma subunit)/Tfp pilus assembly protein PilF
MNRSAIRNVFCLAVLFCLAGINSGNAKKHHKVDSLKSVLAHAANDSVRLVTCLDISTALEDNLPDTALFYAKKALEIARKSHSKFALMPSYYHVGLMYDLIGDETQALAYLDSALAIALKANNLQGEKAIYNELGNIYSGTSRYPAALENYYKSLQISNSLGDTSNADLYSNIGLVFQEQGNYTKALENFYRAMRINQDEKDERGQAVAYCNIGIIYDREGDHVKAQEYNFKALVLDSAKKRDNETALDYSNIGDTYNAEKEYVKGMEYDFKALDIAEKLGYISTCVTTFSNIAQACISLYDTNKAGGECVIYHNGQKIVISRNALLDTALAYDRKCLEANKAVTRGLNDIYAYEGMAQIYERQNKRSLAIECYQRAAKIGDSIQVLTERISIIRQLARVSALGGDFRQAYNYAQQAIILADSQFNENQQKALSEQETQFEYDKKILAEQKEREKEKALAAEQSKRQKLVIAGTLTGLAIVLVFMVLLYKRFRVTNQQRRVIEEQKKEVDEAYDKLNDTHLQLQERDKDITDSIAYAQRIQNAILPTEEYLSDALGQHFVLFKPRDVVSGDFYWCHKIGDKVIFAVADCTGHGVPGAFMSVIGNSLLNQVVIENRVYDAAGILTQLRINLLKILHQRGEEVTRDGMDIALCIWDRENNTLEYSGANSPMYLVRENVSITIAGKLKKHNDNLLEVLADKQPIGYQEGKMEVNFTSQKIELKKGDCIYISSDGFHDQFGGEKNKKFTSSAFRNLISSLTGKPMIEQKTLLANTIDAWKGNYAQTDDICVMGIKIV